MLRLSSLVGAKAPEAAPNSVNCGSQFRVQVCSNDEERRVQALAEVGVLCETYSCRVAFVWYRGLQIGHSVYAPRLLKSQNCSSNYHSRDDRGSD